MVLYHLTDPFLAKLLRGDEDVFGIWYQETVDDFSRYVEFRYGLDTATIADLIAQFYVKMRRLLPEMDADMTEDRLYGFCRTVLNNLIKDSFKKKKEIAFSSFLSDDVDDEDAALPLVSDEDVAEFFAQQYAADAILDALRDLSQTTYDIFYLKYMEGYDYETIAERLDMKPEAVRQQHSRTIKRLQVLLGDTIS